MISLWYLTVQVIYDQYYLMFRFFKCFKFRMEIGTTQAPQDHPESESLPSSLVIGCYPGIHCSLNKKKQSIKNKYIKLLFD